MEIQRFVCNMIQENCYLIWDENKTAALIDCGAFYKEEKETISSFIETHDLNLVRLLNTHGHFDHVFGASYVYDKYNIGIEISEDEEYTYKNSVNQMKKFLHLDIDFKLAPVRTYFKDNDIVRVGDIELEVIETPGHTPGGVCFYDKADKVLFSGDSLFRHEIGRCDLPGGNESSLVTALKTKILTLPNDVIVLPGHGATTSILDEKTYNVYLR